MAAFGRRLERGAWKALAPLDAAANRLYGWRYNPLYHSGALVVALMGIVLVTGIYLLLFYRIGSPYDSVARLTDQAWAGRWIRSLHRYASDAAIVAALIHAFRLFAQGRSWGPRTLAWVSGLVLLFIVFVCGWTGYVMVWDIQGIVLAQEGARWLDVLPLFSEPIGRAFVGDREIPSAFFFLNLFLHVALPVGVGLLLWIHVARVARPGLLPPKGLLWGGTGLLFALSVLWPITMAPAADLFRLPERAPFDVFYSFWLPVTAALPAGVVWGLFGGVSAVVLLVPIWVKPRSIPRLAPSVINPRLCEGCGQCYQDCPYEAIQMLPRTDGREGLVGTVMPALCASCGICAGSCAPMGVGPPGRTGRDQLATVKRFVADRKPSGADVVIVACDRGAGGVAADPTFDSALVFPVDCGGSVHTSVIEYLVRSGVGGVLIVACPPRDCWSREGPRWLTERLYHDREAELKPRVDRNRIRVAYAGMGEPLTVLGELQRFRDHIQALAMSRGEAEIDLDETCDPLEEVPA
jgi:ferredoxin